MGLGLGHYCHWSAQYLGPSTTGLGPLSWSGLSGWSVWLSPGPLGHFHHWVIGSLGHCPATGSPLILLVWVIVCHYRLVSQCPSGWVNNFTNTIFQLTNTLSIQPTVRPSIGSMGCQLGHWPGYQSVWAGCHRHFVINKPIGPSGQ